MFLLRPLNAGRRLFPRKRHADGFGTFNFATLVFLLLARHSPQAVSARAACVGCHQKYRESRDDVAGVLYLFSAKSTDRSLRLVLFAAFGRLLTAVFARGVLCTFWPQKVPKTPRQMPAPTSSRLTLAPGDYSRGRTCPVPFARAFSRAFVSRLRHRAGVVRRETRREGCVRDKQKAQKPTIAPGSGFQPPHYRLERNKNNRQPACPEREAGKGVRRRRQIRAVCRAATAFTARVFAP